MHTSTKLLMGVCAAAFVASTATAQSTDSTTRSRPVYTRHHRRIAGSGIRVTKEGSETRTGSASGTYGTTTSSNRSTCTAASCSNRDSLSNAANAACVGTTCTGNANLNANACTGSNCNPNGTASISGCTGTNCTNRSTLVPSNVDTMTYGGELDTAMFAPNTDLLQGMTDENILAHLAMGDSMEIRMAQRALRNTQDQRVRDFANMLITDHTQSLQQGEAAAQQAGITPQLAVGDTTGMRLMDRMNMPGDTSGTMSGMNMSTHHRMAYSDANFIRHNVWIHRHMLSELQTLQGVAKNDAVRNKITATIPVVQKHLTAAQQLASQLNVDLNARMNRGGANSPPPATR